MISILGIVFCFLIPVTVFSWLPPLQPTGIKNGRLHQTESLSSSFSSSLLYQQEQHRRCKIRALLFSSTTSLEEKECDDEDEDFERPPEDYTGKTIFQRTFYRLSPDSQLQLPNSIMLEERLRFQADTNNEGYILPIGPRTLIVREGTEDDELTDELFRMDLFGSKRNGNGKGTHNGPRSFDTEIATILYLASNPKWIQGDVLELTCGGQAGESCGIVGLLGCISAKLASMTSNEIEQYKKQRKETMEEEAKEVSLNSLQEQQRDKLSGLIPQRMHHLTLSDESPESLNRVSEMYRQHFSDTTPSPVSVKQVEWSYPRRQHNYAHEYRTIVGSDLDLTFPTAKELSKAVANLLLPSNEFAIASIQEGAETSPSFGALGMDPEPSETSHNEPLDKEVDPSISPTFIHLCPDYRDEVRYLRQFLEKGYLMTVRSNYVNMERLQFYFQTLPQDSPETEIEGLDSLEVQEDSDKDYQSLVVIHHPDYAGDGSGEYFFPLETGAYEGGGLSASLEPDTESGMY